LADLPAELAKIQSENQAREKAYEQEKEEVQTAQASQNEKKTKITEKITGFENERNLFEQETETQIQAREKSKTLEAGFLTFPVLIICMIIPWFFK
jgi:hypothetical protein